MSEPLYGQGPAMADRMEDAWEYDKQILLDQVMAVFNASLTLDPSGVRQLQEIIGGLQYKVEYLENIILADPDAPELVIPW